MCNEVINYVLFIMYKRAVYKREYYLTDWESNVYIIIQCITIGVLYLYIEIRLLYSICIPEIIFHNIFMILILNNVFKQCF